MNHKQLGMTFGLLYVAFSVIIRLYRSKSSLLGLLFIELARQSMASEECCMFGQKRFARTFCSLFLLGALLILSLAACGTGSGNGSTSSSASGNISTPTASSGSAATPTTAPDPTTVPLTVTSVTMAVNPASLSSYTCGTNVTVTYTATFNFSANNAGGPVSFQYTTDNGRGDSQDTVTVQPGQTSARYKFTWSGNLPADHTQPLPGGVMVTTPNQINSPLLGPSGSCTTATTAAFQVTSVTVKATPSVAGQTCGSTFTETYTATFHIAPNGPGGVITFTYSTNNGQSSTAGTPITVGAGDTKAVSTFTWTGTLPADHTAPGVGAVAVTLPNQVTSTGGTPTGQCTGA
jgi:hypothetical protein